MSLWQTMVFRELRQLEISKRPISDIHGVSKQVPDVSAVIRMARCENSCLQTKYFEANIEQILRLYLGLTQYKGPQFTLFIAICRIIDGGFLRRTSAYNPSKC